MRIHGQKQATGVADVTPDVNTARKHVAERHTRRTYALVKRASSVATVPTHVFILGVNVTRIAKPEPAILMVPRKVDASGIQTQPCFVPLKWSKKMVNLNSARVKTWNALTEQRFVVASFILRLSAPAKMVSWRIAGLRMLVTAAAVTRIAWNGSTSSVSATVASASLQEVHENRKYLDVMISKSSAIHGMGVNLARTNE